MPIRKFRVTAKKNVKNTALVEAVKIILLPLHTKMGIMKNTVKAMEKGVQASSCLKEDFSKLSDAKMIEGKFVGPQVLKLMEGPTFDTKITNFELAPWSSLRVIAKVFLGNRRDKN